MPEREANPAEFRTLTEQRVQLVATPYLCPHAKPATWVL